MCHFYYATYVINIVKHYVCICHFAFSSVSDVNNSPPYLGQQIQAVMDTPGPLFCSTLFSVLHSPFVHGPIFVELQLNPRISFWEEARVNRLFPFALPFICQPNLDASIACKIQVGISLLTFLFIRRFLLSPLFFLV